MKIDLMRTKISFFYISILMKCQIRLLFMVQFVCNHIKKLIRN